APVAAPAATQAAPEPVAAAPAPAAAEAAPTEAHGGNVSDSSVRVDVTLLDRLMTLVGELVLSRNQILQFTGQAEDSALLAASQRLNLITTELQEGVMKTRMQPIGNVWAKFPRVVRDLSRSLGKQVALEMEGKETELDKSLVEAIKDPLTHMVRNSVDHGIERPEARVAKGKPAEGTLRLRAYHEGGQVIVEIIDDGGGIDPERIRRKAIEKGVITAEQGSRMADREIQALIFAPGFSTAEQVTNVSGRGVGMDVVKTNIEKIGGSVDVHSVPGEGTTLKIKIPLTLAIIPALTVATGGERFCIPQVSLVELVRVDPADGAQRGIERIHGAPVYRLRGQLLPLCDLADELAIPSRREADGALSIVVLQADGRQFGLMVEEVHDTEEIVVKPLGNHFAGIPVFAGATIMGDGRVALILDVLGLAQRARVLGGERERQRRLGAADAAAAAAGQEERQSFLVFGVGVDRRMAMPLAAVQRLEELEPGSVEWAGDQEVVQYRGELLPLLWLSRIMGVASSAEAGAKLQVVVYAEGGRQVGLVVDCIHDIVEEAVTLHHPVRRPDLTGTAVIQQRVTDLVDVRAVVRDARPWLFEDARTEAVA
ncbi:MAG: chemotaxis protein CheA, partial [Gemmatimonadales bacterium]|nr:chemotaxis protein CheA [Gemmatimonadales bacterium]